MARRTKEERKEARAERGARGGRKARGGGEKSTYRQKIRAKQVAAKKGAGCTPKLFMLALPFAAAGAFLLA